MFCKECGKHLADDARFCPSCGAAQVEQGQEVAAETARASTGAGGFDFHQWVVENNLETYEQFLKSEDLDSADVLVGLTEADLARLDLTSIGAQKKILNAIQKLKSVSNAPVARKELAGKDAIPNRCPNCGGVWGMEKENTGAGNTLGKALVGGLLLGPIGAIGGAAFGNKTTVYVCKKCGFKKQYKSSLVKGIAKSVKNALS